MHLGCRCRVEVSRVEAQVNNDCWSMKLSCELLSCQRQTEWYYGFIYYSEVHHSFSLQLPGLISVGAHLPAQWYRQRPCVEQSGWSTGSILGSTGGWWVMPVMQPSVLNIHKITSQPSYVRSARWSFGSSLLASVAHSIGGWADRQRVAGWRPAAHKGSEL